MRSFCADGPSGTDMKMMAAVLSTYGPLAVRKVMAMLGSKSNSSKTWPPGKTVKIAFQEKDTLNDTKNFAWNPETRYFHEMIMKHDAIGDFEVSYKDEDGDKVHLDATKLEIEEFLADHSQHPNPKLLVEWRPPTTVEIIQSTVRKAKNWLTGEGAASDQAVKDAQEKVEKEGGKITVSSGSGRSLVDHKGYKKEEWPGVVDRLAKELRLSEEQKEGLLNAVCRDDGKGQSFLQEMVGNKIVTQFTAYHTVCHGDKIDVVYGKHEESMEVSGGAASLPSENCIQYNDTLFAVWPGSPHSKTSGEDMKGLTVEIPSGWQVVDSSQEGFDSILQRVIAPYGWHTFALLTSGPDGKLQGWCTASFSPAGGKWYNVEDYIQKKDAFRFHFKGASFRLLIQAHPSANHELVNNWKRYVQLSAQREWSQRLGMAHGGAIEA